MRFVSLSFLLVLLLTQLWMPTSGAQEGLKISVSHSILADVTAQIAGDAAEVSTLIPPGADPHAFQVSPRDLVRLSEADLVLLTGIGLEASLLEAIEGAAEDTPIVIVSSCVPVLPFSAAHDHEHDHAEDDEHQHESDEAIADRCAEHREILSAALGEAELNRHGSIEPLGTLHHLDCADLACDPHVWHDPRNVMYWSLWIRDSLTALDPANAALYEQNTQQYLAALQSLYLEELQPLFAAIPAEQRVLVTNHDSFGYLANSFDLHVVATVIPGGSTLAEPSARELAAFMESVQTAGVRAIFAENTANPQLAEQLAEDLDIRFYRLYSDSLNPDGEEASTYLDYMRYNAHTIAEALQSPHDH